MQPCLDALVRRDTVQGRGLAGVGRGLADGDGRLEPIREVVGEFGERVLGLGGSCGIGPLGEKEPVFNAAGQLWDVNIHLQ